MTFNSEALENYFESLGWTADKQTLCKTIVSLYVIHADELQTPEKKADSPKDSLAKIKPEDIKFSSNTLISQNVEFVVIPVNIEQLMFSEN